ncbi:MAG: glycosyltransferase family 4 protein [Proteobacteria bacterium]|nr:glycosyltransferase family 4 protein [Pseudomonadota bacterium]
MKNGSKMKIAVVGDYPLDEEKIEGGVQSAMVNLVHGLAKTGKLDIHVVAPKKGISGNISFTKDSINYHFFPKFTPFELSLILGVNKRRIFERLLQIKPAIVHAHSTGYSYLCRNSSYPIIITPHGIPQREAKYRMRKLKVLRTWLHGTILGLLLSRYTRYLILISEYSRKVLKLSPQARYFFIPNPVRSNFFALKNREVKDRLLFVAADISPLKNPLLLLKALPALRKRFHEISLHMVGDFNNSDFFDLLKEFISQNQIEQNVRFTGLLTEDEVVREYEECSVFVLTSDQENLPMVVQQAMAAGKAVIATRVGGVPELIRDGATGLLVEPGDLEAVTKGIALLLRDDRIREGVGRAAKEEALRRFTGEAVAKSTYEAYQEVLKDFSR